MNNPEVLNQPRRLSALKILVHPLYLTDSDRFCEEYKQERIQLYNNALERFCPVKQDEALLMMPSLTSWCPLSKEVRNLKAAKENDPSLLTWTDLYKDLKKHSVFCQNVKLVDNVALDYDASVITQRLQTYGFYIDSATDITLGGEWRDFCVDKVAWKVLQLPFVNSVKIDKHVSNLSGSDSGRKENYVPYVAPGFIFRQDEDFVYLSKAA